MMMKMTMPMPMLCISVCICQHQSCTKLVYYILSQIPFVNNDYVHHCFEVDANFYAIADDINVERDGSVPLVATEVMRTEVLDIQHNCIC